ncbi:AgmX/PglI C-terminal domain-containing protein [uncultured Ferrimonas sp.]|uniref:AgmX/PglI C-terminal domain-containing protein n=1 Tax=uncultured Ferrimonas sp. TaxID=432640 RepID=UPI002616EA72|nr:AgmX/PglI C-terminal domain-containing protein [uncultured Ferrimonas sp.]
MSSSALLHPHALASAFAGERDPFQPSGQDRLFKLVLSALLAAYLVIAIIVPSLEQVELPREVKEQLPPQLAKIMLEKKQLPPPEQKKPQPKPEPEPELEKSEPKPEPKPEPVVTPRQNAKETAQNAGLAAMKDELFSMREALDLSASSAPLQQGENVEAKVQRNLLGAKASAQSAQLAKANIAPTVASAEISRNATQQVRLAEEEVLAASGGESEQRNLQSSGGQRSEMALRRTLEANKSRLYAMYNRALRKDPLLQGKVMFEIEIQADGQVSQVKIQSSELANPKLERQLLLVLRSIRFPAESVDAMTTIWAIDFLPS